MVTQKNFFARVCGDERNTLLLFGEPVKALTDFSRLKANFQGKLEFIVILFFSLLPVFDLKKRTPWKW